jgi:formate dehydrogenase
VTEERIKKAPKLKLALTAGIGSDHVDLLAASKGGLTVAEVTGSNTVSVAEHVVMMILSLVRNYMPAHQQVKDGKWNIAEIAAKAYDLEGKKVGTVGAGRIGQLVLQRLGGFNCEELLYYDYGQLDKETEEKLHCRRADLDELISTCDVVTINCPLHEGTRGMFNKELIGKMKKGSYLVNTARGAICDTDAVKEALESGHLAGYAGDVWYPQPAPPDHPWRTMPNQAMTPHYSGTTLDAQERYAAGTKDILQRTFDGEDLKPADIICKDGKLAPQYDKAAKEEERKLKHAPGWEKQAEKQAQDKTAGQTLS